MNYALQNPIKRDIVIPDDSTPFAPAFSPKTPSEIDQTHRNMTWKFDNRQQTIGNQPIPESARLEKKK
jgi:hypothetical protein